MSKIQIYTFTYNNADILPFVIDYWKSYATKVVVYDNMSTDCTINLLQQYDWIELYQYDTNNKYDIDKINQIKQECISNSKLLKNIDYVLVCDIDEVLRYTDDLDKVLADGITNKSNVNLNYYEVLFNKFPNYQQDILLQNFAEFGAVESLHINKKSVKPVLINLHANNSSSYINLEMLHLKFLSSQYLLNSQNKKLRRTDCLYNFIYGNNTNDYHSIYNDYNNCLMNNRYKHQLKRLRNNIPKSSNTPKPYGMIQKQNTTDIQWIKTKIIYTSAIKNKQCVIVIPVYKTYLEEYEIASMIQLINTVGNEYDICLVCPDGLYINYYNNICNYKFNYLKCNPEYFKNTYTYSKLLENYYFYEAFRQYEYMMIYQNDGWIFYNNIKYFISLNYDYIGSPWGENEFEPSPESVGNGGVSFRKISKFIDICHNITPKDLQNKYAKWEDLFFCKCIAKKDKTFKIAPVRVAVEFSLDFDVQKWIKKYNANPMCAHAFNKRINEWKQTGRVMQYDITNNITPLCNIAKYESPIYNDCSLHSNGVVDDCKRHSKSDDILIAIFNYKHDDNAKRWLNILSPYFDVYVLDSGNTKTINEFIQFPNIYYGGLFNETKKLSEKKNYKWVGIITSDVIIDDAEVDKLIDRLKTLKMTRNVGIWSLIGDKSGHSNRYVYTKYKSQFYRTLEGFFIFTNAAVFNQVPYIDTSINLYGHGIDYLQCYLSNKMGYINIVDEDINIYHPNDKGYNAIEARKQSKQYQQHLKVLLNDPDYIISGTSFNTIQNSYEKMIKYKPKKVIYTCISGNYDTLHDDIYVNPDWDYVCFTDQNITSNVWEIRPIPECLKDLSQVKRQRILKIQPHIYLNEYDEVIWCDANVMITSNFDELLNAYNSAKLLFKKHPNRQCIYEELIACVKYKKEKKEMTDSLQKRYIAEGMPENFGLYETNIFYRSLQDERVNKLMDMWANELINNSHRDQLSLTYCIWKLNCKDIISEFDNSNFTKYCKLLKHTPKKM